MYTLNNKYTTGNQSFFCAQKHKRVVLHISTQHKKANKITTLLLKENWTDNLLILNINVLFFIQFYAIESDITVVFD